MACWPGRRAAPEVVHHAALLDTLPRLTGSAMHLTEGRAPHLALCIEAVAALLGSPKAGQAIAPPACAGVAALAPEGGEHASLARTGLAAAVVTCAAGKHCEASVTVLLRPDHAAQVP